MDRPDDNPYVEPEEHDLPDPTSLSSDEAESEIELLREAVRYHDYRYYVENDPVISDAAYDELFDVVQRLEDEFDLEDPNSPTRRVGGRPVEELETREHEVEMLSLDSSEEEEDVRRWGERVRERVGDVDLHVEQKFDGFSLELVYLDGELDRAVTRGDGVEGDEVTENARTISSLPLVVDDAPDRLVLRGEVYIPRSGFQDLNERRVERGDEPFANPRNAAAGTIRQLDPDVVADRPLDIYVYDIMDSSADLESQHDAVALLDRLGFRTDEHARVLSDVDGFVEYREEMLEKREELDHEIDGVIAKVDSFGLREDLGTTARHPRWAYAYKFPAKTGETTVERIVVQVGRTGKLTPVALVDPVDVAGVTISKLSLHNEKQVRKLGVREGARVEIERAGDVIPQVKEVVEAGDGEFKMPDDCPVCGSEVVGEEEHHYCSGGVSCPAQLKRGLEHYCSEDAMDVEGVGEELADTLVDTGLVDSVADLYRLELDELAALEGYGERSAEKLLDEIERSKDVDLASFLTALGIRHVGGERARRLADEFTLEELRNASEEEVRTVDDVGEEVAESVVGFFEGDGDELVGELLELGVEPRRRETGDELEGVKVVFTGSLDGYTRSEATEKLERKGARVTSSVSGETDYVVVGDDPGETKMEDAEEHDVELLDEDEFEENLLAE